MSIFAVDPNRYMYESFQPDIGLLQKSPATVVTRQDVVITCAASFHFLHSDPFLNPAPHQAHYYLPQASDIQVEAFIASSTEPGVILNNYDYEFIDILTYYRSPGKLDFVLFHMFTRCLVYWATHVNMCFLWGNMWMHERLTKGGANNTILFAICCMSGKVTLPLLSVLPPLLGVLLDGDDERALHYQKHIRAFNDIFLFTSMAGKIQYTLNKGSAPPMFVISGQNYHSIGSLMPQQSSKPKFAQLYFYDTENEVQNRIDAIG
ncbi:hypothetical protein AHAS_Ahas10G0078500 [Arachis hypogaea]